MISINKVENEAEKFIYRSAGELLSSRIEKNETTFEEALEEILNKYKNEVTDKENLRNFLMENISAYREQKDGSTIFDKKLINSKWWSEFKKNEKTAYWDRYEKYLIESKNWKRIIIKRSTDKVTDNIMNFISNPLTGEGSEKRGIVVGYVQSGKTSNYIGLINKAIDAGYKMIIVLSGMHNDLRSQTQSRIDEEVLGYESIYSCSEQNEIINRIGVGNIYFNGNMVQSITSRDNNGDFDKKKVNWSFTFNTPTIIVTKKQSSILKNIIKNFKKNPNTVNKNGNKVIGSQYPLLLIDDEADQASINTNYEFDENGDIVNEDDASTINKLIRELFSLFECRSYVGYTATPYANIFIPNDDKLNNVGNDLFPKDFIISLPKPSKYIGAKEFFGSEENEPMPLTRIIKNDNFVKNGNRVEIVITDELKKAIMSFIINIAVRNCRGYNRKPNSMLIHVDRRKDSHKRIYPKVREYYESLQEMLIDGDDEIIEELKQIWDDDYKKTTLEMKENYSKYMEDIEYIEWSIVYDEIIKIVEEDQIDICMINGDSKDSLMYKEHEGEIYNVIAIGGDKLSRGLTLEGLSISYFCRSSKMYDTLMQMGRWFGFREGYADLCRVYVTQTLFNWFKIISDATEDLRDQIEYMADSNYTPQEFGLKVATSPELKISNDKKIKTGTIQYLNFSNNFTQTRDFDLDKQTYNHNFKVTEEFLLSLGENDENFVEKTLQRKSNKNYLYWPDVNGVKVAEYIKNFHTSRYANKVVSLNISNYIKNQLKYGGLINWTVCLVNIGEKQIKIADKTIGQGITRSDSGCIYHEDKNVCSLQTLTSKDHEYLDFTLEEKEKADRIRKNKKSISDKNINRYIRSQVRKRENGLLIIYPIDCFDEKKEGTYKLKIGDGNHSTPIGLAIVFPDNKEYGELVSYTLNPIASRGEGYELFD